MHRVTGLIVKLVELCNLNCSYCYMYNHVDQSYRKRPKFMSTDVFHHVVERAAGHLERHGFDRIAMTFHGGEPMLLDAALFRTLVAHARARLGQKIEFALQTNATLVSDDWLEALVDLRITPGVSIDGPRAVHDRFRVFHDGRGSYNAVVRGIQRMRAAGIEPSLLCVIQPGCNGLEIYSHFRSLGFRNFDFLLPDISHDARGTVPTGATPVADYLIPIFDEWFGEDDPRVTIRLFRSLLRALMGARAGTEVLGGSASHYLVIDTDGSIHANDCLKVCETGLSDSGLNVRHHELDDLALGQPLVHRLTFEGLPVAEACRHCPELPLCGGGGAPTRYSRARGFDNASVWCEDLKKLIGHVRGVIENGDDSYVLASRDLLHERHRRQHLELASAPSAGHVLPR
jgi:uncharacterized protein